MNTEYTYRLTLYIPYTLTLYTLHVNTVYTLRVIITTVMPYKNVRVRSKVSSS